MIKVTAQNGTSYEFPNATGWEVFGGAMKVFKEGECIAEFSSFLLVQVVEVPVQPEEPQP